SRPLRALQEAGHQLVPEAFAAAARDDGDRQLRRLLVDEAEARLLAREEAVPRGPDRVRVVERDEPLVARPAPVEDVAGNRQVAALAHPPVVGVAEHVAEEADVPWPRGADHRRKDRPSSRAAHGSATSACASWNGRTRGAVGGAGRPARETK